MSRHQVLIEEACGLHKKAPTEAEIEHNWRMHFTPAELSLAASSISAAAAIAGVTVTLHGTRRREHNLRIWDQQRVIYEEVLVAAAEWTATRNSPSATYQPRDDAAWRQLSARLRMFGDPSILEAYSNYLRADREWAAAKINHADLLDRGDQPPSAQATPDEIRAAQSKLKSALESANQAERTLIAEVQRTIHRSPKRVRFYRLRLWRRRDKIELLG